MTMKFLGAILALLTLASCDRTDAANGLPAGPKSEEIHDVAMSEFGDFDYVERMAMPDQVRRWNGKLIRTTGYMNPGRQIHNVKEFELVKDRDSCCYGTRPKMNHFFQTTLKPGMSTVYTSDPVTLIGRFVIDEKWDGDWPLGLYWLNEARIVK